MAEIDVPDGMKANLGPLPVWVWGAVVGIAVVAYVWFSGRTDGSVDATDNETTGTSATATGAASVSDAIDGAFATGTASGSTLATTDIQETADSNTAWGLRATSYLVGQGVSPVTAQRAINAYLNGDPMTAEQSALVDKAILGISQPPVAVEINSAEAASAATYSRYYRDSTGQIKGVTPSGNETNISDEQYISAGMPALSSDAYPWKYHKASGNSTTLASIAARYKVSVNRLIVLNKWKTVPTIRKGTKVKVPA